MKHVLLLSKQDVDLVEKASEYLSKQAIRPSPEWYARLLEEHGEEIALAITLWLSDLENTLAVTDWYSWTDAFLWIEFEAMLARRLEPALRNAAQASSRRQAVEVGEPIPVRLSDLEIVYWSEQEARRQAQLIAGETRAAMLEAFEALDIIGLSVEQRRRAVLEAGLFALNRRYARAALRPMFEEGVDAFDRVLDAGERLLMVRREMIVSYNTVSAITEGFMIAAMFWQREGRLVTKVWNTQADERVCFTCFSMHFQEVPLRGLFVAADGATYERPPAHPGCRCFTHITVRPTEGLGLAA